MSIDASWIDTVRSEGILLVRTRITGEWGCSIAYRETAQFHFVGEGRAFLRRAGSDTLELQAGDFVLLPQGDAHEISHTQFGKTIPLESFVKRQDGVFSEARSGTTMVCGSFPLDRHLAHASIRALPSSVVLRANDSQLHSSIIGAIKLLSEEAERKQFANQVVIRNLLSTLFVYVVREWSATVPSPTRDWISGLHSPQIARALSKIHEEPALPWTNASLAAEAGLSRSAFSQQFKESIGYPPHVYLTRWRMGLAVELLEQTELRLAEIADRVGFRTEFSFSRAFSQARGISPMRYREQAKAAARSDAERDRERSSYRVSTTRTSDETRIPE